LPIEEDTSKLLLQGVLKMPGAGCQPFAFRRFHGILCGPLVASDQSGHARDEYRAQQPPGDDPEPQVTPQQGAVHRKAVTENRIFADSGFVGPPIVFLMKVDERNKDIERVQQWA